LRARQTILRDVLLSLTFSPTRPRRTRGFIRRSRGGTWRSQEHAVKEALACSQWRRSLSDISTRFASIWARALGWGFEACTDHVRELVKVGTARSISGDLDAKRRRTFPFDAAMILKGSSYERRVRSQRRRWAPSDRLLRASWAASPRRRLRVGLDLNDERRPLVRSRTAPGALPP
jgi:hypothetical protein